MTNSRHTHPREWHAQVQFLGHLLSMTSLNRPRLRAAIGAIWNKAEVPEFIEESLELAERSGEKIRLDTREIEDYSVDDLSEPPIGFGGRRGSHRVQEHSRMRAEVDDLFDFAQPPKQESTKSYRAFQLVAVEWVDARLYSHTKVFKADDPEMDLAKAISVGHLIREDSDKVCLAMDWMDDLNPGEEGSTEYPYRTVSCIPRGCIIKVHKIEFHEVDRTNGVSGGFVQVPRKI